MFRFSRIFAFFAVISAGCMPVFADDAKEIDSVTVLADARLAVPLSELASRFAQQSMISVAGSFGVSADQKKKIEDGESADLFITSDPALIEQLKIKGLVDVYSIQEIARSKTAHFTAAIVAGENMTPARNFLAYLKTTESRKILFANGLTAP